jgi:hypothetical protein
MIDGFLELARRGKGQAPPAWVVYEALCNPFPEYRQWFDLESNEMAPKILEHDYPHRVVWSSIWVAHPELLIEFDIEGGSSGSGCNVTWVLLGPTALDSDEIKPLRYRLNQLINDRMRNILFDL